MDVFNNPVVINHVRQNALHFAVSLNLVENRALAGFSWSVAQNPARFWNKAQLYALFHLEFCHLPGQYINVSVNHVNRVCP
jgi:hypothetical protein